MNFESVRSIIDTYIKKNGVEAITGDILNNVLNTMLDDVDTAISSIEPSPGGGSGEGGVSEGDVLNILEKNAYATQSWVNEQGFAKISDYYTKGEADARYLASSLLGSNTLIHSGNIGSQSVASAKSLVASDGTTYVSYNATYGQVIVKGINIGYGGNTIETASGGVLNIQANSTGGTIISPSGGNVLIGTTKDSGAKLQVKGNIDSFNDGDYSGVIGLNRKSAIGGIYNASYAGWQIHNHLGDLEFFCEPASGSDGSRMVINSSGNVGIGTTNPTSKLHIVHDTFPNILLESTSVESSIYFKSLYTGYGWAVGTGVWNQHFGIGLYEGGTSQWILSLRKEGGTDLRGGLQIYRQFYNNFDEGIRVVGASNEYCGIFLGTDSQYYGYTDHQWNLMKTSYDTFAIARGLSTNVFFQISNNGDTNIYGNLIVSGDVASA